MEDKKKLKIVHEAPSLEDYLSGIKAAGRVIGDGGCFIRKACIYG
ncbi:MULTISPECIES: hypothetical protein [Paenibacillus]